MSTNPFTPRLRVHSFAIAPVLLGAGEHLLCGIDVPKLGYQCTEHVATPSATHVVITKQR